MLEFVLLQYLLKVWLLKGKADDMYRAMWEQAMDDMIASLLHASTPSRLKYIADYDRQAVALKTSHYLLYVLDLCCLLSVDHPKCLIVHDIIHVLEYMGNATPVFHVYL